jgi:hypothetical protein
VLVGVRDVARLGGRQRPPTAPAAHRV